MEFNVNLAAAEMRKKKALAKGVPAKPSWMTSSLSPDEISEANAWFDVIMKQVQPLVLLVEAENRSLRAKNEKLDGLAQELVGELQWCSGSGDFAPGGKAYEGWKKGPAKALDKAYDMFAPPYKGKIEIAMEQAAVMKPTEFVNFVSKEPDLFDEIEMLEALDSED